MIRLTLLVGALVALPAATAFAAPEETATPFIYDGNQASEGEYPHQALVATDLGSSCGGTLVSPTKVLTAAHCTEGLELLPEEFYVLLGSRNIGQGTRANHGDANVFDVAAIDENDDYDPVTLENDTSMLTLEQAVPYRTLRVLAATETSLWEAGDPATVIGWGERENGEFPSILYEAGVPMISDAACDSHYEDPITPFEDFYPATMVCAGTADGDGPTEPDSDTCQGDSGGPLMVNDGTAFALVGVTSWGGPCGEGPGVYARIGSDPLNAWVTTRLAPGPPDNDAFAGAFGLAGDFDFEFGHFNADATKEGGEPPHAGNAGGKSLWYSWTAPSSGPTTVDTCDGDFDTLIGVYTGSGVGGLTPVASDDDSCLRTGGSFAAFTAQQGQTYLFAVDGKNGASGTFDIYVELTPTDSGGGGSTPPTPPPPPTATGATAGSDTLFGTRANNIICGLGGSDLIRGLAGNDTIFGDQCGARARLSRHGARAAARDDGNDRLFGDTGNDRLFGSGRNDRLFGGRGNDLLVGGRGRDSLSGGRGRDRINSRDGRRDTVNCGPGRDRLTRDRRDRVRGCERVRR